jgi:hypothetical protein
MAVPVSPIDLSDVIAEIGLASDATLADCVAAANSNGFDPTYQSSSDPLSAPFDLLDFRNYKHIIITQLSDMPRHFRFFSIAKNNSKAWLVNGQTAESLQKGVLEYNTITNSWIERDGGNLYDYEYNVGMNYAKDRLYATTSGRVVQYSEEFIVEIPGKPDDVFYIGDVFTNINTNAGYTARTWYAGGLDDDDNIYVIGGRIGVSNYLNDVNYSYDGGNTWVTLTGMPWSKRKGHNVAIKGNSDIILIGGKDESGNYLNDVWYSSDSGNNWTQQTASAPFTPREDFGCAVDNNGDIYIVGGRRLGGFCDDIWKSSDNGQTWNLVLQDTLCQRADHEVVIIGGELYFGGGMGGNYNYMQDWYKMNLV